MARVLLLDDSPLVLNATKDALEAGGHQVTAVDDPAQFLVELSKSRPDLSLVDVSMPALEGDAVAWIARAHQLHPSLIVCYSAKTEADLQKLVESSGADGFITKTPDNQKLLKQITGFLARKAPPVSGAPG